MEFFALAGQAIIGIVYIIGTVNDFMERASLQQMLQRKGIPYDQYLIPGAMGLKVVCSLGLIFNTLPAFSAFLLAGFTLVANIIFHPFWSAPAADRKREYFAFAGHLVAVGGLMVIVGR